MPVTIWNFFLVINLTVSGNWAVIWPLMIATSYVSCATTLNTRGRLFKTNDVIS